MKFVSTRGRGGQINFNQALVEGLSPDRGLYVPKNLPILPASLLIEDPLPYPALACDILQLFSSDDNLIDIVDKSYGDFSDTLSAPLQQLNDNLFVLELFHGPTLSFKDFGLQLMGNLLEQYSLENNQSINVLGATSGDTGSAAIHGLTSKKGINVFILYPKGRISDLQERQMACTESDNIFPISIDGSFDDAQKIVKSLMGDVETKKALNLHAVNSINIVRILAQCIYYVHAYMQLPSENKDDLQFVVPTGNFGNVFSGWLIHQMGLPVDKFIVATNQNDILHRLISTGNYSPGTVTPSLAPSMDIQIASNFERLIYYLNDKDSDKTLSQMQKFEKEGLLSINNFYPSNFVSTKSTDKDILDNIKMVNDKYNYIVDPHTACCFKDLDTSSTKVVISTAHPAKFPGTINKAIGQKPTVESLDRLKKIDKITFPLSSSAQEVKNFIKSNSDKV